MPDAAALFADPDWMPHAYDGAADRVLFLRIPPETRKQLTFLADHRPPGEADAAWIAGDVVRAEVPSGPAPSYIFHSAFCRSTLLVKALDAFEHASGLSEPMIFNSLQSTAPTDKARGLFAPILALLGRRSGPQDVVIAKPSNFANGLVPILLQADGGSRAICIYGTCEEFLRSVAKKGLEGRIWARRQLAHNRRILPLDLGMDENAYYELSDLQAAALMWLHHVRQFDGLAQTYPDRVRTLQSAHFNAEKARTLDAAARFFGIGAGDTQAQDIADGPLFQRHAKQGGDYEKVVEAQAADAQSAVVDDEIGKITQWIGLIAERLQIAIPLRAPLA